MGRAVDKGSHERFLEKTKMGIKMKTIKFKNLVDSKTGKTVEIEVPDDFDENNPESTLAGKRGAEFGARIARVVQHQRKEEIKLHLRQVNSLKEVGDLGRESATKLRKMFEVHGFGCSKE